MTKGKKVNPISLQTARENLGHTQTSEEEKPKKQKKYRNERVKVGNHFFDSKAEYRRYNELKAREMAGEIRDLEIHPAYVILPDFTRRGKAYKGVLYVADFSYKEWRKEKTSSQLHWAYVVEDVKGVETEAFRVKKKLFLATYPGIIFRVVKRGVITDY
jgi:hypothetical protein